LSKYFETPFETKSTILEAKEHLPEGITSIRRIQRKHKTPPRLMVKYNVRVSETNPSMNLRVLCENREDMAKEVNFKFQGAFHIFLEQVPWLNSQLAIVFNQSFGKRQACIQRVRNRCPRMLQVSEMIAFLCIKVRQQFIVIHGLLSIRLYSTSDIDNPFWERKIL
jgi:hypothetical protein